MFNGDKQNVSDVNNSVVQQAAGDIHNHYGLSYNDVTVICHDVIRQEMAIVTKEAADKACQLVDTFTNSFIERLSKLEQREAIDKFKEPRLQMVLHDVMKEYIKSHDDATKEDLIDILIDRLNIDENCTEQYVIEDAIQILPRLSIVLIHFLGALLMRQLQMNGPAFVIRQHLNQQANLFERLDEICNLDIAYLKQLNCCTDMSGLKHAVSIEEMMIKRYDLFFRKPTTIEAYQQYVELHPLMKYGVKSMPYVYVDATQDNECKLFHSSLNSLKADLAEEHKLEVLSDIQSFIDTIPVCTTKEVEQSLVNINPNWKKAIELMKKEEVATLQLTPVGTYIASKILQKEKFKIQNATLKELY